MVKFWGFNITRDKEKEKNLDAIAPVESNDGSTVITAGGSYGTYIDVSQISKSEAELIQKYRDVARMSEVSGAIEEIVNEFVDIEDEEIISIDYSPRVDEKVKKIVTQEFEEALRLLDFKNSCYDIIKRWYIDGRLKYNAVINKTRPTEGLVEVRYIDPRKLKKIREVSPSDKITDGSTTTILNKTVNEYYIYNEKGFGTKINNNDYTTSSGTQIGLRIEKDSIIDVPSGLNDSNNQLVLSYLDEAIKPLNQLRTLEDASIIYTLARAPERRVWYIDVGDLPPIKAKQHFNEMVNLHKNKVVYNAETGDVRDDRKYMTMLEDYWLPRRGDQSRDTEVTTLPGGANMGEMGQIEYFEKKLYKSLKVPVNRLNESDTFALGRSTQITRDEVKFAKFIARLRLKFSNLFLQIMEKNLLLKGLLTLEDWKFIKGEINVSWASASYFEELKEAEVIKDRMETMQVIAPYIGVFYSKKYVRKNVLKMTDEEIEEMDAEIVEENIIEAQQNAEKEAQNINTFNKTVDDTSEDAPEKGDPKDKSASKEDKIQQAKTDYDQLKNKKRKTSQEQYDYKSAAQILGKAKR